MKKNFCHDTIPFTQSNFTQQRFQVSQSTKSLRLLSGKTIGKAGFPGGSSQASFSGKRIAAAILALVSLSTFFENKA